MLPAEAFPEERMELNKEKKMNTQETETLPHIQNNVDASREDAVERTYYLLQTNEDCAPVEGMGFPLACLEYDATADSNSMNTGEPKYCSSVNLPVGEQPEICCPHESNGTMEAVLLPLAECILPTEVNAVDGESFEQVSGSGPDQQQQSPSPPGMDPTDSRAISPESKSVITENRVLQKLLRRWRYFDSEGGNSHLEYHAVNFHAQKGRKPCYVCGQLQHNPKKCPKRRNCFHCKGRGHIVEHCPMKDQEGERICLRCGEMGHEIFSCSNDYSPDDLKNIRCYFCNELGHIFCGNDTSISPTTVSCYNCGESGHLALACPKPHMDKRGSRPPSICYKCGEEGHFARRCIKDVEVSTLQKCGQGALSPLVTEADAAAVYQTRKRARRSKPYKHGRIKKQNSTGVLECMTV